MSYNAGDLSVEIIGVSKEALNSLDAVISRLKIISPILKQGTGKRTVANNSIQKKSFTENIYLTNKLGKEYLSMSKSVQKTGKELKSTTSFFNEQGKEIKNIVKTIDQYGNKVTKISGKNSNKLDILDITKWGASIYMARKLGRVVGQITQAGADYTETLNLWETAMGNNLNLATKFVNKMNEAYGISEKTLMNAQAIFKNMLGSLGQISDTMAYSLSEGITQMALDYASLYNVTFEKAFTKFQAALAGQVRPIRSVSGYDITENTIFQLYQSLGGNKSMRQLSRTEKQLLSILAIFKQMSASGAVGDLDKTMESFANQSRVMAEAWQRITTYSGVLLTHLIQESGILKYLNATLLFLGDTLKVYVESIGAIKSFGDPFKETTDGALETSDAIDEVKGKLLGFDKFRALNSGDSTNILGLDEKLLQALSGYSTILNDANMEARKLADSWLNLLGITRDENGELVATDSALTKIKNTLIGVGIAFGAIFSVTALASLVKFGSFIGTYALIPLMNLVKWLFTSQTAMAGLSRGAIGMVAGFILVDSILSSLPNTIKKVASGISILIGLVMVLRGVATKGALGLGTALAGFGVALAGIKSIANVDFFAKGASDIDGGSIFVAGEANKTEMVYNGHNGKSNVANVQQIEQAMYNALYRYGNDNKKQPIVLYLDGEKVYESTTAQANKRGKHWA